MYKELFVDVPCYELGDDVAMAVPRNLSRGAEESHRNLNVYHFFQPSFEPGTCSYETGVPPSSGI
jgi:hypothetical protein